MLFSHQTTQPHFERLEKVIYGNKVLPTKSIEHFHLSDASADDSKAYVNRFLGSDFVIDNSALEGLGGRLNDLSLFITKIQAGSNQRGKNI